MAGEGFEGFHVPQQSRRDKLRVTDDSVIHPLYGPSDLVKEEASGLLAFVPSHYHLDPQSSLPVLNMPTNNPFLYHLSNDTVSAPAPATGHALSLSLSSHHHHHNGASTSNDLCVPLGPFTGYASILRGSRFLKPAQHLLEEFCDAGPGVYADKFAADPSLMDHPPLDTFATAENRRNKSRLISLLDEVYRRYKQYYQQMQAVVASFEYVAGLGNAAPYANFALKTMSKHFKCLKNAITDQLQFSSKSHGQINHDAARYENVDRGFNSHRPVNNSGYLENQSVWRPQRGLPERAVTVLRAWLFEHFLHPYPTDTDKLMLAKQTGLSRSQVSNWFINARVRLWKPMVEEIHMLETRQSRQREEQNGNLNSANSMTSQRIEDSPSKRSRNDDPADARNEEQVGFTYNNVSRQQQAGVGGSGSVSLTLGLHQNNGMGLSEAFPMNAAQRFGLAMEGNSKGEGYVMGGFEGQHGLVGGQLLHDFVG